MSHNFKNNGIIFGLSNEVSMSTPTALQANHKCDAIHDFTHQIAPNDTTHIKYKSISILIYKAVLLQHLETLDVHAYKHVKL